MNTHSNACDSLEMDELRASDITQSVCDAWFVMNGLSVKAMPDLGNLTLREAMQAASIVRAMPPDIQQDGSCVIPTTVDDSAIPLVLARARSAFAPRTGAERAAEVNRRIVNAYLKGEGIDGLESDITGITWEEAVVATSSVMGSGFASLSTSAIAALFGGEPSNG